MNFSTLLQNVQFVTDAQGHTQAVQIDWHTWEALMAYLEEVAIEEEATEELLAIPNLLEAIEQSKQRVKAGEFIRYQDLKREV
ncbi:MAG: hypothetical protein HC877_02080 [Thioploca sp.]|nr:hypothetical protein [Thioploca sp.]